MIIQIGRRQALRRPSPAAKTTARKRPDPGANRASAAGPLTTALFRGVVEGSMGAAGAATEAGERVRCNNERQLWNN